MQHGQVIFLRDVALLVAGFVSWRITRGLRRKQREVANQLRALTAGGADLGARLPVTSSDEIGALTTAFNAFQDSLGLIVRSLLDNALKLSAGTTRMSAATNQMSAGADSQTPDCLTCMPRRCSPHPLLWRLIPCHTRKPARADRAGLATGGPRRTDAVLHVAAERRCTRCVHRPHQLTRRS